MKKNPTIPLLKKAYAAELESVQNYLANLVKISLQANYTGLLL